MRVFTAGIGTETNTFSPLPTGIDAFHEQGYFPAGTHPEHMTRYSAPMTVAKRRARQEGWTILDGVFANTHPAGLVSREAYEGLRDELLADLRRSLPVDVVLLGLHGAMVADGYDDCEGDIITRVREVAGPDSAIGCELDPHAHLSDAMVANADVLIAYKEYPHSDIEDRAVELVDLCAKTFAGEIRPVPAVIDTDMVIPLHTSREPGLSYVARMKALEGQGGVLSVSTIQGFATGDVPDMGTKVLVYTDADLPTAHKTAQQLADELISLREEFLVRYLMVDEALDAALSQRPGPVILADRSDNPGSGAAGDSTFILQRLIEREITNVALGPLWDPVAVQTAFAAGVGARLPMRVGGKTSPMSGSPVDEVFRVKALRRKHTETNQTGEPLSVGDAALVEANGIECVLTSERAQALNIDLFTGLGCTLDDKAVLVVKSAHHFYKSFSQLSPHVLYVGAPGSATPRWSDLTYQKARLPKWPISEK
ncbi:M81 family metallopeptidase [Streptomyces sp. NPDC057684]|uniref:M81 family metallopeptidase n=1 Tax=unclassified Streptomyces TaxID=2593676 RepID=UPI00368D8F84